MRIRSKLLLCEILNNSDQGFNLSMDIIGYKLDKTKDSVLLSLSEKLQDDRFEKIVSRVSEATELVGEDQASLFEYLDGSGLRVELEKTRVVVRDAKGKGRVTWLFPIKEFEESIRTERGVPILDKVKKLCLTFMDGGANMLYFSFSEIGDSGS